MIVRNRGNNTCYFPYAGSNGIRGKNLAVGECSEELPVPMLENRLVKRHWENGYIDILLNAPESAIYSKQFKLAPTEGELHEKGYTLICRPGTMKRPITQPIVATPPRGSDPPLSAPPPPKMPSMGKEGEKIDVKRVLEDPTLSPLGSPLDSIPTVIKEHRRIPVEKYQSPKVMDAPPPMPDGAQETPIMSSAPDNEVAKVVEAASAPIPAPAEPVKRGRKSKKAEKSEG